MPPDREAALAVIAARVAVPRETQDQLDALVAAVARAQAEQNLVSTSTLDSIWIRHMLDSAQLLFHVEQRSGRWLDIGSGAGFPGLVIAILSSFEVTLAEPRRLRAAFLTETVSALGLDDRVRVEQAKAESLKGRYELISARAVAPVAALLSAAAHLAGPGTTWLLPKGRNAANELAAARQTWQGSFAMVPSVTDPEAAIIVASGVRSAAKGRG